MPIKIYLTHSGRNVYKQDNVLKIYSHPIYSQVSSHCAFFILSYMAFILKGFQIGSKTQEQLLKGPCFVNNMGSFKMLQQAGYTAVSCKNQIKSLAYSGILEWGLLTYVSQ